MATIVQGGIDSFRAMAYQTPHHSYLESFQQLSTNFNNSVMGRARDFFNSTRERLGQFSFESARRRATAAMRKVNNLFNYDGIVELNNIGEFQHAKAAMRRYLMSEPSVRKMYYEGSIEGYSDLYDDTYKGKIGQDDPLYRNVMDGLWQEDENGQEFVEEFLISEEQLAEERLSPYEQMDVHCSWQKLKTLLDKMEEDPTSPYNNML